MDPTLERGMSHTAIICAAKLQVHNLGYGNTHSHEACLGQAQPVPQMFSAEGCLCVA